MLSIPEPSPTARRTFTVSADFDGVRADIFLRETLQIGRRKIRGMFNDGAVTVNGAPAKAGQKISQYDRIEIPVPHNSSSLNYPVSFPTPTDTPDKKPSRPRAFVHIAGGRPIRLLYESEAVWVIDKPPGIAITGGHRPIDKTLAAALDAKTQTTDPALRPWRFVHRLDRDTSGCLIIARVRSAETHLLNQFKLHRVTKHYIAICSGVFDESEGVIDLSLARDVASRQSGDRRLKMRVSTRNGLPATTSYRVRETVSSWSIVEIVAQTGRTHQVRAHLAAIGHPLAYDPVYGRKSLFKIKDVTTAASGKHDRNMTLLNRTPLHASAIGFTDPASDEFIEVASPLPKDMAGFIQTVKTLTNDGA